MERVGFARPTLGPREEQAVKEVLRSGWLGLGPKTQQFERVFAHRMGAKFAVGVNSGTSAVHLGLLVTGIRQGDEVLIPTITFVATAHAVRYCGATPIFVDVDPDTLNIDVNDAERKLTPKTKAIVPVHLGGHPCDLDQVHGLADAYNLIVVEDSAQACGARYKNHDMGDSTSKAVCFSFDPIKNMTTVEGGMVTTNHLAFDKELRVLRNLGRESVLGAPSWMDEIRTLGYRYHMNDVAAAMGMVQLDKLIPHNLARERNAILYDEGFQDLEWLVTPPHKDYCKRVYFSYVVLVKPPKRRKHLMEWLDQRGVGTGVHYKPLHLHSYYFNPNLSLPVAEEIWPQLLTLPMHSGLKKSEVEWVIEAVREFGKV